jgi:hypothetical protein
MMVMMLAMLAFAIDVGYLAIARSELQRSADAAAIAATWELIDQSALVGDDDEVCMYSNVRSAAGEFAGLNHVLQRTPGLTTEDVDIGYLANPSDPSAALDLSGQHLPNAVRVRVRRASQQNGEVPFFIARILGVESIAAEAEATAALLSNFRGYRIPSDGSNLEIIPLALDEETWIGMLEGGGDDCWRWDEDDSCVRPGSDGRREVNLYPLGTGSPGNRGTVDIGGSNNSTNDIARQVVHGISPEDLEHHGGKLEFDGNGELMLNGDTGISAGIKDELASIIGKKRIIPIFRCVEGPGNNAVYTIVAFAGVRIMSVKLTGAPAKKKVMIQPETVISKGGIYDGGELKSFFVYSPVWLVR